MAESRFVLDTSSLLALRDDEPGSDRVEELLVQAKRRRCRVFVSFMTRMEMMYLIRREEGDEAALDALRLVDTFEVDWVSCETEILEQASFLKAKGGLSVADSWIAATAIARDAILIHKDPEFAAFDEIAQEALKDC